MLPFGALVLMVVAAVAGIAASSVFAQVAARGVGWLLLAMSLFGAWAGGFSNWRLVAMAAACGLALWVSRPLLARSLAQTGFAPVAYRHWFLVGVTGAMTVACMALLTGLGALAVGQAGYAGVMGFLALWLAAAALAVVKMRAWGAVVGVAAAGAIAVAAGWHGSGLTPCSVHPGWSDAFSLGFVAVPITALGWPLVSRSLRSSRGSVPGHHDTATPATTASLDGLPHTS